VPHDTPRVPQGPLVLPGDYTVRLTVGDVTRTASLRVTMDPRVTTSQADLARQLIQERTLSRRLGEATKAVSSARAVREQIAALGQKSAQVGRHLRRELDAFDAQVKGVLAGSSEEGSSEGTEAPSAAGLQALLGRAGSLYGQIGAADVAPTPVQTKAADQVDRDLETALAAWHELAGQVPVLNSKLAKRGLPPLDPDAAPSEPAPSGDVE